MKKHETSDYSLPTIRHGRRALYECICYRSDLLPAEFYQTPGLENSDLQLRGTGEALQGPAAASTKWTFFRKFQEDTRMRNNVHSDIGRGCHRD